MTTDVEQSKYHALDTNLVSQLVKEIKNRVSLTNKPIGISLIRDEIEIPPRAKRPSKRDMTWPMCLAENMVRVMGWTVALTLQDHFCMYSAAGLGHIELPEYLQNGAVGVNHAENTDLGLKMQREIETAFFNPGSTKGVMLTPATDPQFLPQAVFIYGNPTQIGKIAKGIAWYRGEPVFGTAGGFGCCVMAAASAIKEKVPRVIIPAAGAKILGHCEENEVMVAVPVDDLPEIINGMEATNFLLPYPTAKYLMFEPRRLQKGYPIDLLSQKTYSEWKNMKIKTG